MLVIVMPAAGVASKLGGDMSKRVLLAEDEPNIVLSLSFLLEREGFDVTSESDGYKALSSALSGQADVVNLDVMLPGLDGFEILRQLRADSRGAELPVLVLTAKGQREDRENALAAGANLFISKPFANDDVIAAVRELAGNDV
jgi:DNA-binding response OmpR family regulator